MSRPHENDENDVSFSMKTQSFENALQCGKIENATVSGGRVEFTENATVSGGRVEFTENANI